LAIAPCTIWHSSAGRPTFNSLIAEAAQADLIADSLDKNGGSLSITKFDIPDLLNSTRQKINSHTDPLNPELEFEHLKTDLWTSPIAVASQGDYAYVAFDVGLAIYDVSDPTVPTRVGKLLFPEQDTYIIDVVVAGSYAYLVDAFGGRMWIVNIENPTLPVLAGFHSFESITDVAIQGDFAYCVSDSLYVLSLTIPSSPVRISAVKYAVSAYRSVAVSGNLASVVTYSGIGQILDISNPNSPLLMSSITTSGQFSELKDSRVYYQGYTGSVYVVRSYDLSTPSSPVLTSSCPLAPGHSVQDFKIEANLLFVALGDSGVAVLDVTNPAIMTLSNRFDTENIVWGLDATDSLLLVCENSLGRDTKKPTVGLSIYNVSTPTLTNRIGFAKSEGHHWYISCQGNTAFLTTDLDLILLDITNRTEPSVLGSFATPGQLYGKPAISAT